MAYVPTKFVDRSVEFPNRRTLTAVPGQADTVDIGRAEGTVFAEGTKPDAANLNAEFEKIKTETDAINQSLTVEKIVKTYSVSANASMTVTFDISKEEYTPIGIVGFHTGDTSSVIICSEILEDNVTARIVIKNIYSGELSNRTAYLKVLYKKNI